ncbi:hypothetical protein [Aequorivita lipolytica]|uniref:DUF4760 domain-containing protein n=1 Tax=Aequorivita lipolytica TaxID=153267 RepID=A0A5C6YQH5_9FLAO|nr:hypothetical protein [Aequorivita lipolytica]TXD69114.1 hypothetical protein ESV24_08700 [Aequorivita lipolytica]SRX51313.1 hypothetical protein AEQU2_01793 [Aequorivita lipolytica]
MTTKKQNIVLRTILIIAIGCILVIKFIFVSVPEIWDIGSEIGEVTYDLSLAYIVTYLFYEVVVALPKKRDLKNIYATAKWLSFDIAYTGSTIIKPNLGIQPPSDIPTVKRGLTKADFETFCLLNKITDTYDFLWIRGTISPISYLEHFKNIQKKTNDHIEELFRFMSHLETDHIRLLNDIRKCAFMRIGYIYLDQKGMIEEKENLSFLCPMLYEFYQCTINLDTYIERLDV